MMDDDDLASAGLRLLPPEDISGAGAAPSRTLSPGAAEARGARAGASLRGGVAPDDWTGADRRLGRYLSDRDVPVRRCAIRVVLIF